MKKIELLIKKAFLWILLYLVNAPVNAKKINIKDVRKVLFIRLNRIGDALVSTPLIKIISEKLNCEVHILADKKNYFVFENNPSVYKCFIFDKGIKGYRQFIKLMRQEKYDAVIDLHDDVSATVTYLLALSKIPLRIGLSKGNNSVYTHTVQRFESSKTHVIDRSLQILELLAIDFNQESVNVDYCSNHNSIVKAQSFISNNFDHNYFLVGINISAGSNARFWGVERYKHVISDLTGLNINIIILAAEKDRKFAKDISGGAFSIFCSPSFDEFAALISKLNFLFTPDTAAVHLASAFKIPLFGIYVKFNTTENIWYPYKSEYDCIVTEEANLQNLEYELFREKFLNFFKRQYQNYNTVENNYSK